MKGAGKKRLPPWLKKRLPAGPSGGRVREILNELHLNTVCGSAVCPNISECFHRGTAAFLIMGPTCTRSCAFCAVKRGNPKPLEQDEPARIAEAVRRMDLHYAVITSVTRDDLADGGAAHFAATIRAVKAAAPAKVEVLVSDFGGSRESIATVLEAGPDVFNHNIETVRRLYPTVRPQADYRRSLDVLRAAKEIDPEVITKSGLMVGLGETTTEVEMVFEDLLAVGCSVITVGQYLAPSKDHLPVARFVEPKEFDRLRNVAEDAGFAAAYCGPFVRSSYMAENVFANVLQTGLRLDTRPPSEG